MISYGYFQKSSRKPFRNCFGSLISTLLVNVVFEVNKERKLGEPTIKLIFTNISVVTIILHTHFYLFHYYVRFMTRNDKLDIQYLTLMMVKKRVQLDQFLLPTM